MLRANAMPAAGLLLEAQALLQAQLRRRPAAPVSAVARYDLWRARTLLTLTRAANDDAKG